MEDQLRQRRLEWLGHLWRMPDHRIQKQLMRCRPSGRRRPPGGAPLRWNNLINRDLSRVSEWQELIGGRLGWHAATHQPNLPLHAAVTYISHPTSSRTLRQEEEEEVCVCVCVRVSSHAACAWRIKLFSLITVCDPIRRTSCLLYI